MQKKKNCYSSRPPINEKLAERASRLVVGGVMSRQRHAPALFIARQKIAGGL